MGYEMHCRGRERERERKIVDVGGGLLKHLLLQVCRSIGVDSITYSILFL